VGFPVTGRILVVDDQRANSELLAGVLKARGYEVSTAPSGEAALAAGGSPEGLPAGVGERREKDA